MNKNRVVIFLCLAAGLILGMYLNWSMISRDMARLEPWKVPLLWVGDLFSLLFAFQWMLKQDDDSESGALPQHLRSTVNPKLAVFLIAGAFLFDIAATGYSLWDSKQAMERAVVTQATIQSAQMRQWADSATHYKVVVNFNDQHQGNHQVTLKFTNLLYEQPNRWLADAINSTKKGTGAPIRIVYDPIWPQRVWVAEQPIGTTTGIAVIFSVIHILQTIFVAAGISGILHSHESQVSRIVDQVRLFPLVCEVCLLILFGLLLHD